MKYAPDPAHAATPAIDRRRFPRITVLEQLDSRFVSLDVPVRTCDFSPGGFAIEAPMPFPVGAEHEFVFTLDDGTSMVVTGRATHTRPVSDSRGALHRTGFEFVFEDLRTRHAVETIVSRLTSVPDAI